MSSIKDLENRISDLGKAIEKLGERVDSKCEKVFEEMEERIEEKVHTGVLEHVAGVRQSVDQTIDARFKTTWVIAGALIAALSTIGYFGVQSMVVKNVDDKIGKDTLNELDKIRKQANTALAEIQAAQTAARSNPPIVLQTDFGPKSPYMGALIGSIFSINPQARIQVSTCEIDPFDVTHAAWALWRSSRYYPPGTIFVALTNPGGLTSQMVVLRTQNGHTYIGFDNGCFDLVVEKYGFSRMYTIASPELTPPRSRDLFGGIDVCGPTAAHLSLGFKYDKIGPASDTYQPKLANVEHQVYAAERRVVGTIMDVDDFGNATSNITQADLEQLGIRSGQTLTVKASTNIFHISLCRTYGNVSPNEMVALLYDDLLQFAINQGSFRKQASVNRGSTVEILR